MAVHQPPTSGPLGQSARPAWWISSASREKHAGPWSLRSGGQGIGGSAKIKVEFWGAVWALKALCFWVMVYQAPSFKGIILGRDVHFSCFPVVSEDEEMSLCLVLWMRKKFRAPANLGTSGCELRCNEV